MRTHFDLYSRANQYVLDGCCFAVSLTAAYMLRIEGWPTGADLTHLILWLPILVAARLFLHRIWGIYRQVWKFVSFSDTIQIAKSIAAVTALLVILRFCVPGTGALSQFVRIPASIIAIEGLLSFISSMGVRALRRVQYQHLRRAAAARVQRAPLKRALLYGAGRAGIMLRRELEAGRTYEVVGFVDDDPMKVGTVISNMQVVGSGDQLSQLVKTFNADEVIISMATANRSVLARTLTKCRRAGVTGKIIPGLQELLTGQLQLGQPHETRGEDVLGRESVQVPRFEQIAGDTYRSKRVLVTGAGGSIGSELVRQLVRLQPSKIAVLDKDENSVFELDQELRRRKPSVYVEPMVADIRNCSRLRALFHDFCPEIVIHAAAHKHVPLMEMQPCEAVLNNVGGTRNVLDAAAQFNVERFVFISSDKAVNPTNVMGATKRIGELLVQTRARTSRTRAACVRFGNVLGSRGSVIPIFNRQIADGGPVTVTHPDIIRYFMTIPEAVQLILCAGTLANNGEIFVLDMGKPRNILELAREMILLSGFEPEKDIETRITGLRPGERLHEELSADSEKCLPTGFEKITVIAAGMFDEIAFARDVQLLMQHALNNSRFQIDKLLARMHMGFQSQAKPPLLCRTSNAMTSLEEIEDAREVIETRAHTESLITGIEG